jgi:hypothetical protein
MNFDVALINTQLVRSGVNVNPPDAGQPNLKMSILTSPAAA